MRRGALAPALLLLSLQGGLSACEGGRPSAEGVACRLNSDCEAPLQCRAGECLPECREARDCAAGLECREARCVAPQPGEACSSAEDCPGDQTCIGGVCSRITLNTLDAGFEPDHDAGVPGADAGSGGADGGPDGGAGANLPYGAVCASGTECASGLCLGPSGAPAGRCTKPCTDNVDCTYPDTCTDVPGAGMLCASSVAGGQPGDPCPNDNPDCASGVCLQLSASNSFCTQPCSPLPACPAGMTCAPVPDGAGGAVTLCVPGGAGQGFGGSCARASDCATNLCVGVPSTGQGVCTSFCDAIPCPSGYTCTPVDDGAGGVAQVCAPGGAVGGSYGDTCTGAASCNSGLCLNDPRLGGAFCTQSCISNADCAAIPGLVCVRLSTGEQVCAAP